MECPKCHLENPDDSKFCKECGTNITAIEDARPSITKTVETPREELTSGTTFAKRYQIIEELGKGGMGFVYKVLDKKIAEKIALKLIKPEIASDRKTLERFGNELKLARKIVHRNVGRMYDINEDDGTHYITMEYVSGQDLKGFIRQSGQMGIGTAISIAKQICAGLTEAHKIGIVHRDLKPNNIMIDKYGEVRIMDFGIARSLRKKGITGSGVMIGTPEYMSPEQAEAREVDHRSDIYSLGVILYEMVTGRVPFEGDTPLSIAMKHKGQRPEEPTEINSQVPQDLNRVILKCLEKDREKRYQSIEEVYSDLDRVGQKVPTTQKKIVRKKPLTSSEITVRFSLKKLLIPGIVLLALIAAALIILQNLPQTPASIAVLPFRDLSPQQDQEHLCEGLTLEIIGALSDLQGWQVMNMASVLLYKDSTKDPKTIGRELDVTTLLLGSVRKEEEDLRIIVQLVNVKDNFELWSDTYERKLERIFAVQSEIAEKIAQALNTELISEK